MSQTNPQISSQPSAYPVQSLARRKSLVLANVLEVLIAGLGFLYAGAGWGKAAIMSGIAIVLVVLALMTQQHSALASLVNLASIAFLIYRWVAVRNFVKKQNSSLVE